MGNESQSGRESGSAVVTGRQEQRAAELTVALHRAAGGDRSDLDALLPLVYDELRAVAARQMSNERRDHTLQATAVVNEAYLRLVGQRNLDYRDRAQFFAAAANVIRRLLVDHARGKGREKRGGGEAAWERITLAGAEISDGAGKSQIDLVALNDAVEQLAKLSERAARVVELRFFGGLSMDEVAETLGVSPRTAADDWALARAWLRRELAG